MNKPNQTDNIIAINEGHPDKAIFDIIEENKQLLKISKIEGVTDNDPGSDPIFGAIAANDRKIALVPAKTLEGFLTKVIMLLQESLEATRIDQPHYITDYQAIGIAKDLHENETLKNCLNNCPVTIKDINPHIGEKIEAIGKMHMSGLE